MNRTFGMALMVTALLPGTLFAQVQPLRPASPADVATPEAIVEALYTSIARAPGQPFDWDRNLSLFLPSAKLIPNTEQMGGSFVIFTPGEFMEHVDRLTQIGGPNNKGFQEEQISAVTERFGDIAHVFSTYQKHFWDDEEIIGRGVNSIQLVWHQNRWWISSIIWDEENGAGPLPTRYLPG